MKVEAARPSSPVAGLKILTAASVRPVLNTSGIFSWEMFFMIFVAFQRTTRSFFTNLVMEFA